MFGKTNAYLVPIFHTKLILGFIRIFIVYIQCSVLWEKP